MENHEYLEITLNRIRNFVGKYYEYSFDFEFIDLVTETVSNALYDDDLEDAIKRSFTYTKDEWTILKKYCFPESANWKIAEALWRDQITDIYNQIKEKTPWED